VQCHRTVDPKPLLSPKQPCCQSSVRADANHVKSVDKQEEKLRAVCSIRRQLAARSGFERGCDRQSPIRHVCASEEYYCATLQQTIRFTRSVDEVRLAYAESGIGPPLVKAANWLSHLEFDWQSPVWRHWFGFFSSAHRLIRYDARGCGLSDWEVADLTLAAQVADLEAVVEAARVDRFALIGISQGGAVAIEYSIRHPERVSHLVLYGAFARGWKHRGEQAARQHRALNELVRLGWGQENPAFRKLFATMFVPDASEEQERWFSDLMRITSQPDIAARILEATEDINIVNRLAAVSVPTLVIHGLGDACISYSQGREFATGIPGAKFVTLESRNHILLESEPAWARFREAFEEFTGQKAPQGEPAGKGVTFDQLTARELDILGHLARGLSNAEIAKRVFISEKTVRNHLTSIFSKLDVDSRAKAIVLAREGGLIKRREGHSS
jgi:pimeloyl-ACP methyl ester carboxylesterase/DNA-binding CsgD family transcriptional regulator